jgi:hypothetical protein
MTKHPALVLAVTLALAAVSCTTPTASTSTQAAPRTSAHTPTPSRARATSSTPKPSPTQTPTATHSTTPAPAGHPHVMVIVEENHSLGQVIGNGAMPYLNSLARSYALATDWSDLSHPSLPNYLGLLSGSIQNNPADTTPQDRTYPGPTLVDELAAAGISWKAYLEDMPTACDKTDTYPGNYDVNHNPFMYFTSIRDSPAQCARVVPFTGFNSDLASGRAPDFIWVSPNLIHDMHNGTLAQGDAWLRQEIPIVLASSWYRAGGVVIITFDEGETTEQVATLVISQHTKPGARLTTAGNHYGTLRAIEETYSVALLGGSAHTTVGDLRALF